jgi:orotidine-5'-phosphate decarboxylase
MTGYAEKLDRAFRASDNFACVGLDPVPDLMPVSDVAAFNQLVVDATHDLVCAYKPQLAFYEALGVPVFQALEDTVEYIRRRAPEAVIIGDGKRADISSTAAAYARAMFKTWDFDAATVNAYQGDDAVLPFLDYPDRGVYLVCLTSNDSAERLQTLRAGDPGGDSFLYEQVAGLAAQLDRAGETGLVLGANRTEAIRDLRAAYPRMPFLIPGVGAQQGDARSAAAAGIDAAGSSIVISSSRAIIYAPDGGDGPAPAIRTAAQRLRDTINSALQN